MYIIIFLEYNNINKDIVLTLSLLCAKIFLERGGYYVSNIS